MARPGKEQVFFLGTVAVTGLFSFFLLTDDWKGPGVTKGQPPEALAAVDVAKSPRGALKNGDWVGGGRETFREPRDWNPLPPADLERPPLREPSYVPPPPRPSVGLDRFGLYRTTAKVTPHNFADEGASGDAAPPDDPPPASAAASAPPAPKGGAAAKPAATGATSTGAGTGAKSAASSAPLLDDAELRRRYDWLDVAGSARPIYGVIENKDRYTLPARPAESIQFRQIDPKTNRPLVSGAIPRERVKDGGIHFAETPLNLTELALRTTPESQWSAATLPTLLDQVAGVFELGRADRAAWRRMRENLVKYVALDPKSARAWEMLADVDAALLDFEDELKALQQAEAAGATGGGLVERHARWLVQIGAREGALARLKDGVVKYPADRGLRLAYGRLLLAEGRGADALEQFAQAEGTSTSAEERMQVTAQVGSTWLERGECDKALAEARRILGVDKDAPLGHRLEGAALLALGKRDEAAQSFAKLAAAAKTPDWQGEALLAQGIVHTRAGEFEQALGELRQVVQVNPLLGAWAAIAEADLLATTGHLDEAIARARDAAARAPDDPYLHYFLGRLLRESEDLDGARAELRHALDLGATFADLFNELGYLALLEGKAVDARRYFDESIAREDRPETRLFQAHAQLLADDLLPARATFESLNSRKPTGESMLGLAYVAYRRGETPDAQAKWQQVKEEFATAHPDDKAYAAKWLATVIDLESKQQWDDPIQWREVGNEWVAETHYGPEYRMPGGSCRLEGKQNQGKSTDDWTYLKRDLNLALFVDLELEVALNPGNQGRTGFGLVHFSAQSAGQAPSVRLALMLSIDADGTLRVLHKNAADYNEWVAIKDASGADAKIPTPAGESIHLTLRRKERGSSQFQFFVDGAPVGEPLEMTSWRGKSSTTLAAVWFGSAPGGKKIDVEMRHARRSQFLPQ
ncbi:MAG TPA: tetratricopeptide repeat protein [Planctomycetota bacterium]|nr:tetratricopeptide repeat protein [Planctomycetota bacterium]